MGEFVISRGREVMRWRSYDGSAEARWWVAEPGDAGTPLEAWFSDPEIDRILRLRRESDRCVHFLAHGLAKVMLCEHAEGPDDTSSAVVRHDLSGRPSSGCRIELSISHSVDSAAAAVALPGMVGVDIEPLTRSTEVMSVRNFLCSSEEEDVFRGKQLGENDLLRLWVAKEALVKVGVVTIDSFSRVDLSALLLKGESGCLNEQDAGQCWWDTCYRECRLLVWQHDEHAGAVAYRGLDCRGR